MLYTNGHRYQVLRLLHENLQNQSPQVVSIDKIADALQINIDETRQLLFWMDQNGQIQSNMAGSYSLLTREGLTEYKQLMAELSL